MWDLAINGVDFYHIANWFYIYSFLGWLWETCYVSVRKGKLINRGFINGPLCTIYGCGALAVYLILLPISDNLLLLFVGGVVVATALEYVTAVLMENIFHTSWWDYSDNKFNYTDSHLSSSSGIQFCKFLNYRMKHSEKPNGKHPPSKGTAQTDTSLERWLSV